MNGLSRVVLTGLAAYGLTLAATGVALATGQGPDGLDNLVAVAPANETGAVDEQANAAASSVASAKSAPSKSAVSKPAPSKAAAPKGSAKGTPSAAASVAPAHRATSAASQRITFIPTSLVMPSGAVAKVDSVGLHPDGSLAVPQLPDVGVWNGGAHAGDLFGSMVIAGHVDSRTFGLGVFAELKELRKGDIVQVRSGSKRMRYQVYRTVQVSQQSLATEDQYFEQGMTAHRLVLITCGGPFDRAKHGYLDNFIVLAAPIA